MKKLPSLSSKAEASLQERNARLTGRYLLIALGVGVVVVLAYSGLAGGVKLDGGAELNVWKVLGTGLAVAGAFFGLGLLLGFIFGVPRSVQEPASAAPAGADTDGDRSRLKVNTNLEQISDWLTKILVGVGLTQLTAIPGKLQSLAEYIARGLGGGPSDTVFAVAIILYFFVFGFFTGYLLTRLYLASAFMVADHFTEEAARNIQEAVGNAQDAKGAVESLRMMVLSGVPQSPASSPPAAAMYSFGLESPGSTGESPPAATGPETLTDWPTLALQYNAIRAQQEPGDERTRAMAQVFNQMCSLARGLLDYDPKQDLQQGDAGRRLFAYAHLYARPDPAMLTALVDSVTQRDDTHFGQYRGIQAIGKVLPKADPDSVSPVLERLDAYLLKLDRTTDRHYELSRILKAFRDSRKKAS